MTLNQARGVYLVTCAQLAARATDVSLVHSLLTRMERCINDWREDDLPADELPHIEEPAEFHDEASSG